MININNSQAQVSDWGNLYVHNEGQMHVFSGAYTFQTPLVGTQTTTTRTFATYGKISFADGIISTTGSGSTRFVDGYVRKYGMMPLTYPLGQGTTFAPAKTTPTTVDGVDAAYYLANPTAAPRTATKELALGTISTLEYFHILRGAGSSANAQDITLSWRAASGIATLTSGSLNDLTIAGWNGTQWVTIPSTYDVTNAFDATASTLTSGSIKTTGATDLSAYQFFTFAVKASCQPIIVSNGETKTWNGSAWSTSPTASSAPPTLANPVILTNNYTGNLTCNSLALGAFNVTLVNGQLLEVVNGIAGTGKIIMSSEASLVQRNETASKPNIELTKTSRLMHWRDYMYYGTPIVGNFTSQIITNTYNTTSDGLTTYPVNGGSFDINDPNGYGGPWKYVVGGGGWNALNTGAGIVTGKGFIARIKGNLPWANPLLPTPIIGANPGLASTPGATGKVNFKFEGIANNGNVPVTVTSNGAQYELLANPYPSGLNAVKFLTDNPTLDGSLYFWSANTPRQGTGSVQTYSNSGDYAVWSQAGFTGTAAANAGSSGNPVITPSGIVASGQGFRVRALTSGTATFTNCMRTTTGNTNFFRTAAIDRFKMHIQDNNNGDSYNQIVVAYMPQATTAYDRMYDAEVFSSSPVKIYTLMPDATKLTITAKPTFSDNDVVPLGFSNTTADQSFTISLEDQEGVFASNTVNVYIHDLLDNTYHDMNTPFIFNGNGVTSIDNRFEIVYQRSALSSTDFLANSVVINIKNSVFTAAAKEIGITEVEIFDITGRKIQTYDANNKTALTEPFIHAEGIYIAKVRLANGSIATQKLVNKK